MKKIHVCIFFLSTLTLAWFPVSEIAKVSMVSMLFPWHFSGIAWFPVSEIAKVSMVFMLFPWHFSGIIWHPGGIPWNAMDVMLFPWHFSGII